MLNKFKFICCTLVIFTATTSPFQAQAANNLGSKLLVGYWHNFDNGTGIIKLRDVSPKWDVINVSFGETGGDRSTVEFSPVYGTDAEFKSDISYLKSKGKSSSFNRWTKWGRFTS